MRTTHIDWRVAATDIGVLTIFESMVTQRRFPHIAWIGPPGTGKTTLIHAFVNTIQPNPYSRLWLTGVDNMDAQFMRESVLSFLITNTPAPRFLVIDEADCITDDAQACLAQVIGMTNGSTAIWLISNYHTRLHARLRVITIFVPGRSPESMRAFIEHTLGPDRLSFVHDLDTAIAFHRGDHRALLAWIAPARHATEPQHVYMRLPPDETADLELENRLIAADSFESWQPLLMQE